MIFADALFGISRENALKLSLTKKVKYIALLLNYGHIDFAFDIYSNCKDLQEKTPFLKDYFVKKNKKNKISTIFKILIDKIIFVLLVLRKTNGIGTDSDRSWPIRWGFFTEKHHFLKYFSMNLVMIEPLNRDF